MPLEQQGQGHLLNNSTLYDRLQQLAEKQLSNSVITSKPAISSRPSKLFQPAFTLAISLKHVKIEENLLWRAYRKSPTLFRFFWVAAIFLLPVFPLRPPRRPFLPYFCPYSPAIGTKWYKWTFWQQTMCVLLDYAVTRIAR